MKGLLILTSIALALVPATVSAQRCQGGNPAITHVEVQSTHSMGQVNQYHLVGSVTNMGTVAQSPNTLQFVDIYNGTDKVDSRSIPVLGPSGTAHFSYNWSRSSDAGSGTTVLTFRMRMVSGTNCNPSNGGTYRLRF